MLLLPPRGLTLSIPNRQCAAQNLLDTKFHRDIRVTLQLARVEPIHSLSTLSGIDVQIECQIECH